MMCQLSVVESKSATFPSEKARHLLDDSVLESRSPRRGLALTSSSAVTNGLSLGKRPACTPQRGGRSRRVLVSVCHCAAPGGPSPLQESSEPYFLASRVSRRALGLSLCFWWPWALSMAGKWKGQPDARLRPAVIGWQLSQPGCRLSGASVPGEPQAPACSVKVGKLPEDLSWWATGFSRVSSSVR